MKPLQSFLTTPVGDRRYNNTTEISGKEVIVSTSEEDHEYTNRFVEVLETPLGYKGDIKKGTILVVHHNITKIQSDIRGHRQDGGSFFKEGLFLVEPDLFYLYNNGDGWKAHDRFCFVRPIKAIDNISVKKLIEYEPLMGEMVYPNEYLEKNGIHKGDKVVFSPDSEYAFQIDGETLYRCFAHQITAKLN